MSKVVHPATLTSIHTPTMTVCPTRKVGVPKNRANASAFSANQSSPNTDARCKCGTWKRVARDRGAVVTAASYRNVRNR
jgi:hypothetical protein